MSRASERSQRRRTTVALASLLGAGLLVPGCANVAAGLNSTAAGIGLWRGRFSLTVVAPDGADTEEQSSEDRAQGRFELSRSADLMKLQLFSPFGQTMASATARAGGASLTTSDGKTFQADTTDELVHQVLGWRLPVDSLPAWLSGEQLAADSGWVERNGWRVRVEKRLQSGKPRVIAANWPVQRKADQHALKLLVVVDGR